MVILILFRITLNKDTDFNLETQSSGVHLATSSPKRDHV